MNQNTYSIDMGTSNLKIYCMADDQIINIKNTIALVKKNQIYAYGDEAYEMYEKTPDHIQICFPIETGIISHFNNMQAMIGEVLEEKCSGKTKGADFIVAVPTDITPVERKAFFDMFFKSKLHPKNVLLVDKPLAAAAGIGLDIMRPKGMMIVDIGADTTEIAALSLGGLVQCVRLPFGGKKLDDSIVTHLRMLYNLYIGNKTAMHLKETIGCALPDMEEASSATAVGRDIVSGLPIQMEITSRMIYDAIEPDLARICEAIKDILEKLEPEAATDILEAGIYITGGSSQIKGLADLFNKITNIKINPPAGAEENVVKGLNIIGSNEKYSTVLKRS